MGASPASLAVSSRASLRRPAITTEKPLRARAMAEARPIPLPPPVTMATRVTSCPLVQLLRLDQPPGEAEAFKVQHGGERLQGRPGHGDGLAALDVIDDVPHALLFEQLLGFPGRIGFADYANLGVGSEAAPVPVRAFGRVGDQAVRDGEIVFELHGVKNPLLQWTVERGVELWVLHEGLAQLAGSVDPVSIRWQEHAARP